jgi:hypothetical protein
MNNYIIVEPIEGYTSEQRAESISAELFSLGRPLQVRHPEDVSNYVFSWIKHPDTDLNALFVDLEYELYVHPQRELVQLLSLFPEVSQQEKDALSNYINSQANRKFMFGNIIPSTATTRSREEMDSLGWFPSEQL